MSGAKMVDLTCPSLAGFRRRILITPELDRVQAELGDDFHRMSLTLVHDGVRATGLKATQKRAPWSTCAGAIGYLESSLVDRELTSIIAGEEQRSHCTHLFDLAVLSAAHAGAGEAITYDFFLEDDAGRARFSSLRRNGEVILSWWLGGAEEASEPSGNLTAFVTWTKTLADHLQEAGRVFRRVMLIAQGRGGAFDERSTMEGAGPPIGVCFTAQNDRRQGAVPIPESVHDFSDNPELLLEGFQPTGAITRSPS